MLKSPISKLNAEMFQVGLRFLSRHDTDLKRIIQQLGPPPLWTRKPGFSTLIHLILEQQVSLASARAAMNRLLAIASPLTPARFLQFDDAALRAIGFSRQKTAYGRYLAQAIVDGQLDLRALHRMEDAAVRAELIKLKGIGGWTADTYLLMALRRPDVFPSGDLALQVAVQEIKRLKTRPTPDQLDEIGLAWQPWRAIATRVCWHYYLNGRE